MFHPTFGITPRYAQPTPPQSNQQSNRPSNESEREKIAKASPWPLFPTDESQFEESPTKEEIKNALIENLKLNNSHFLKTQISDFSSAFGHDSETPFRNVQDFYNRLMTYSLLNSEFPSQTKHEDFMSQMNTHSLSLINRILEQQKRFIESQHNKQATEDRKWKISAVVEYASNKFIYQNQAEKRAEKLKPNLTQNLAATPNVNDGNTPSQAVATTPTQPITDQKQTTPMQPSSANLIRLTPQYRIYQQQLTVSNSPSVPIVDDEELEFEDEQVEEEISDENLMDY